MRSRWILSGLSFLKAITTVEDHKSLFVGGRLAGFGWRAISGLNCSCYPFKTNFPTVFHKWAAMRIKTFYCGGLSTK